MKFDFNSNLDMAVINLIDSADDEPLEPMTLEDAEYLVKEWIDDPSTTFTAEELMNRWNEMVEEVKIAPYHYLPDEYNLYVIHTNSVNYLALEEQCSDKWFVFDWDLNEEEIKAIKEKFECDGLTEDDFQKEIEWEPECMWTTDWVNIIDYIA